MCSNSMCGGCEIGRQGVSPIHNGMNIVGHIVYFSVTKPPQLAGLHDCLDSTGFSQLPVCVKEPIYMTHTHDCVCKWVAFVRNTPSTWQFVRKLPATPTPLPLFPKKTLSRHSWLSSCLNVFSIAFLSVPADYIAAQFHALTYMYMYTKCKVVLSLCV